MAADVLVVTEGSRDLLPPGGHVIDAGADWGYESPPYRHKTMLWSRWPLAGGPLIDHVASGLVCDATEAWPGRDDGGRLSDHAGVLCRLRSAD
ncbi:hypothetical protein [Rhodococcus sp. MTM3W5.2]|uniref:hypothetical protein n=1 Tax=Rhodococcus sp. MTM3W5.2 TaxID=1805827 RepID=UPI0011AEB496|nr:hypothetical protein [Rhodococcus sp. MTM3W5.2]